MLCGSSPWCPQEPVEGPRWPELSRDAPRQDDRLERIPESDDHEESGDRGSPWVHGTLVLRLVAVGGRPVTTPAATGAPVACFSRHQDLLETRDRSVVISERDQGDT